jgi:hypothetical protein
MIQLQAELERRTAVWMPLPELWGKVGEMFDVAALDNLVCRLPVRFDLTYLHQNPSPSLPDSPRSLSPAPRSSRHIHREPDNSASSLSNPSRSSSPQPSKSAQLINSSYFGQPFTLPYFRLGEKHWKSDLSTLDEEGHRRRSRSVASTSTRADTEGGLKLNEVEVEMSPDDEADWQSKIYEEEERSSKGVDKEREEQVFDEGIKGQLAVIAEAEERERSKTQPKKRGRPSKARKEKEDTSDLSDAAVDEEEEEDAPKPGRTKRANAGKRKRDSTAKEESEEEKEAKETVR